MIILGDCRDWLGSWKNDVPVSATLLSKITNSVKATYIFNPETRQRWNNGDSVVEFYQAVGAEVIEAHSLERLVQGLEALFS